MSPRECVTLSQYRTQVLKLNQRELAELAKCDQSWVSAVENGFLPRRASRSFETLARAYGLIGQEDQFVRMIQNAKRLKALQKVIAEDFPLELFAQRDETGMVIPMPTSPLLKGRTA